MDQGIMLPLAVIPYLATLLVALGVFWVLHMWSRLQDSRFPPCPSTPLPILGHVLSLGKNPCVQFMEWRKKCGDVFSIYIGHTLMVVVNGYEALDYFFIKRADLTSDRPVPFHAVVMDSAGKGVSFSSGSNWREQRTTLLNILREFDLIWGSLHWRVKLEVDNYISCVCNMRSEKNELNNIKGVTYEAVTNIMCSIITGQRFHYIEESFLELITKLGSVTISSKSVSLLHHYPSLRFLPGDFFHAKKRESNVKAVAEIIRKKWIKVKGYDEYNENKIDNLIAAYVYERRKKDVGGVPVDLMDDLNMLVDIMDLFAAGTETISTTITWCLLYTLHHPDVQEKIYEEIVKVIGTDRMPDLRDIPRLIYLNAVIKETQRLGNVVPLSLPHVVCEDIEYKGYVIPKGTQLIFNLGSVFRDETVWGEDVEKFRPERFIDFKGHLLSPPEFIPYSVGRRACLGETLAKMELFLFLSTLFQKFKFKPVDPKNLPSLNAQVGFTSTPKPFAMITEDRQHRYSYRPL